LGQDSLLGICYLVLEIFSILELPLDIHDILSEKI
jgi:hypothetical protein